MAEQENPTKRSDFDGFLNPERAANYFEQARKSSSVMQLARQVPVGINGQEIVVRTGKAEAAWVEEGQRKPSTETSLGLATFKPKKIAAISVVSAEVVRANPGNYMEVLRDEIAEAFAVAFDNAVLRGVGTQFNVTNVGSAATGSLADSTKTQAIGANTDADGGVYADVVGGLRSLVSDGKKLTGFAFDRVVEPDFLGSVDTSGRPIFVDTPLTETTSAISPGRLIGRPTYLGDNLAAGNVVGYGGDWSQIVWGVTSGINYKVSTEATVTLNSELVSLWEHNLVAILAEAEYGCLINDVESFVKFTNGDAS